MKCYAKSSENLIVQLANLPPKPPFLSKSFHLFSCTGKTHYLCISSAKNKEQNKTFLPFNFQNIGRQLVQYAASEFVLLLRAGAMFSVEHSGLSVYSVFVRGRLRRPVVSLRNPGRILSDTALRGPGFAGVAVGEGPGSGGDRIKNSTTGIIFIKNNYLC